MDIHRQPPFGKLKRMIAEKLIGKLDGKDIIELSLLSDLAEIKILNYGCTIRDWRVKSGDGFVPVILGVDDFIANRHQLPSGGALCGRVANRIAKSSFSLNGKTYDLPPNDGENHLHGGPKGYDKLVWDYETHLDENAITFRLHSPDGDMGYPGNVDLTAKVRLDGSSLYFDIAATTDAPTPINIAQHNYYNLNGDGDVFDHVIETAASHYTPTDEALIPTGKIEPVAGTLYDFATANTFAATDPNRHGIDGNLVLDADRDMDAPIAVVTSEKTGLKLQMWSDQPGLQIFNASWMNVNGDGLDGRSYVAFGGLCLEPQLYPDSVNNPSWPSTIATPDKPYTQVLRIDIAQA